MPSLGVLVTGGIGVLVVLAFVGAVALGRQDRVRPGDRVAVSASSEPSVPPIVAVARCAEERVRSVEVRDRDTVIWRVESEKGTIARGFPIGGEPPALFETTVALDSLPSGELDVVVQLADGTVDRDTFDIAALEPGEGERVGAPCGGSDLGLVPIVFIAGAAGVVGAYVAMVSRYLRRP